MSNNRVWINVHGYQMMIEKAVCENVEEMLWEYSLTVLQSYAVQSY